MNIVEQNINYLSNLWNKYHDSTEAFNNLSIEDNYLVYENQKVDISHFPLNYLFIYGVLNEDNILLFTSEDIFNLVRIYCLNNDNALTSPNISSTNIEQLNNYSKYLPIFKRINIITKNNNDFTTEYINIVDSKNHDHLYINNNNFNINTLYNIIKMNNNITIDEIIEFINQQLPNVKLSIAGKIMDDKNTNPEYLNRLKDTDNKYQDDKNKSVLGNEDHDIIIVSDKLDPTTHQILTNSYSNNNVNNVTPLIDQNTFFNLLNSHEEFTEEQRNAINYYYKYLEDLIKYEDFLTEDIQEELISFKVYISTLISHQENNEQLTEHQQEIIKLYYTWINNKNNVSNSNSLDNSIKLSLKKSNGYVPPVKEEVTEYEKTGFIGTLQVILFIIAFATILTALTLKIIG